MHQLSDNVFLVNSGKEAAIVQLTGWRDLSYGQEYAWQTKFSGINHVKWGPSDNYPNLMRKLGETNNMMPSLLSTARDMLYGSGPDFIKEEIIDGKKVITPYTDDVLDAWSEFTDLNQYEIAAINQLIDNGNIFSAFRLDVAQNWPLLSICDSYNTRIAKPKDLTSGIQRFILNPYFGTVAYAGAEESQEFNKFNARTFGTSFSDLVQIKHSKIPLPGNPYYSYPTWWAAADWIELANLIPQFHISGIKNGYNIKYLIRMPKDYFDTAPGGRKLDEKEQNKLWAKTEADLKARLAGENQVNKPLFIKYARGSKGEMLDNIDIVPLKNEMSDDAYGKILEMANLGITNAMSIMATLAGANPGKGNDSGSQVRVMADYQQFYRSAIPRTIISESINAAIRYIDPVKYKNVYRNYNSVQITTLDQNKSGTQAATAA